MEPEKGPWKVQARILRGKAPAEHKALCYRHCQQCPVFPSVRASYQGLLCNAAGINCHDFSSMGLSGKFLGESTFPFVIRLGERLLSKEDCFVVECVLGFCDALLADLLQESYDLVCLRICPNQFGIPAKP